MKIICVGRNYTDHIKELKNDEPDDPVIFLKPETALLRPGEDFYHPDFSEDIQHEIEVVVRISKMGKYIEEAFAAKYYDRIGLGIDFTARDLQTKLKEKRLPWELSKAFNGSAPVSSFFPKQDFPNIQNLNFSLDVNGVTRQVGNTSHMIFTIERLISFISRYFTLKTGDLIFTGTPAGVAAVKAGDNLIGILHGKKLLELRVK